MKFNIGDKVKRNPKDFKDKRHPALCRIGTITEINDYLYVEWDDDIGGKQYSYLEEELIHA